MLSFMSTFRHDLLAFVLKYASLEQALEVSCAHRNMHSFCRTYVIEVTEYNFEVNYDLRGRAGLVGQQEVAGTS